MTTTRRYREVSRFQTCPFKKHRGAPWAQVVRSDRAYVEWLVGERGPELDEELYDFLMDLLEESDA